MFQLFRHDNGALETRAQELYQQPKRQPRSAEVIEQIGAGDEAADDLRRHTDGNNRDARQQTYMPSHDPACGDVVDGDEEKGDV